jgi:hypothetical protein
MPERTSLGNPASSFGEAAYGQPITVGWWRPYRGPLLKEREKGRTLSCFSSTIQETRVTLPELIGPTRLLFCSSIAEQNERERIGHKPRGLGRNVFLFFHQFLFFGCLSLFISHQSMLRFQVHVDSRRQHCNANGWRMTGCCICHFQSPGLELPKFNVYHRGSRHFLAFRIPFDRIPDRKPRSAP